LILSYFITGTDTDVGKTLVSCALLHGFAARGRRVVGMKPVAAGCTAGALSDDVLQLRAASNITASDELVNPYAFEPAIAPHLAAQQAGVVIDLMRIVAAYRKLAAQADVVIVEGAGGFMVPLNGSQTGADLAQQLGLPVILVVGMRLGCINHALLTVRAIAELRLQCAGWVANVLDVDGTTRRCEASGAGVPSDRLLPQTAGYASNVSKADMPALQQNIEALRERIAAPLLGVVPRMAVPDAKRAASELDLKLLTGL
jgi:dethiobiotin synthetase